MSNDFASLRMDVAREEDNFRVWFRLYTQDAERLRESLDPGAQIVIRARVLSYLRSGGYLDRVEDHDPNTLVLMDDRFTVEPATIELAYGEGLSMPVVDRIQRTKRLRAVLDLIRGVLDRPAPRINSYIASLSSEAIEDLHRAEATLSLLLGNPVWSRPE